jgi:hypothetical protein
LPSLQCAYGLVVAVARLALLFEREDELGAHAVKLGNAVEGHAVVIADKPGFRKTQ